MSERYHVIPLGDSKSHTETGTYCACAPFKETQPNGNVIIIHNAYAGREFVEALLANTVDLDADIAQAVSDHFWELFEPINTLSS